MRRFRLSTLMLLVVITALGVALVVQERRAARREAELQARLAAVTPKLYFTRTATYYKNIWTQSATKAAATQSK
jgi:hypothetical protein